jgi:hypothetical protein
MKQGLMLSILIGGVLLTSVFAVNKQENYQPATVVSVASLETPSNNFAGSNPSDAPMQSEVYSYDIGIRLGCTVYRTRYDSAFDYLPAVFSLNHPIQVNLRRHVLHVNLPGDREVRMGIYGHSDVKDQSCTGRN